MPTHRASSTCPSALQPASLQLHYLAEGAANIIYSVSVDGPASLQDHAHCCVMRLRKNLSFTKPARQVMADFRERIVPLFADGGHQGLLLEQVLCRLTRDMVQQANAELVAMDQVDLAATTADEIGRATKVRHHHRRHVYLPKYEDEQDGILMQNLQGPGIDYLVEFKPKWLVQSPSAPPEAVNCRTCALNAMRRAEGKHQGRGDSGFCPWDLLSHDRGVLEQALARIWPVEKGIERFVDAFRAQVQPALCHLQLLQRTHGAVGLDDFQHPTGKDFGVAMALRDCSVFVALQRETGAAAGTIRVTDVKLADLDLKSAEGGKVEKWAAMEEALLDGGWYVNPAHCSLRRPR